MIGRRKPYTVIGIRRLPCIRCGERAEFQWQCCANGNRWMPLCTDCDIGLNSVALAFVGHPDRKALMRAYKREKGR